MVTCRVIFPAKVGLIFRKARSLTLLITQYIIPLTLTAVFYTLVMRTIWKREHITGSQSEEKRQSFDAKKKRTVIMLMVVTILFALSYLPTHIMHFLMFYTNVLPQRKHTCNASTFYRLCYWLAISSCAFNPFIYCYFNDEFKSEALRYWNVFRNCQYIAPTEVREPPTKSSDNADDAGPTTDSGIDHEETDEPNPSSTTTSV